MATSREGYQWAPASGLQAGLPTVGVIQPATNCVAGEDTFDVVVIGAGYAGLAAARDTATSGLKTLLIEGRDRIGGRTYSADIGGYPYELGGTWVHWFQPHLWREVTRYGMKSELVASPNLVGGVNRFDLVTPTGTKHMSHEDEEALFESALRKFVNVDGQLGRSVMQWTHDSRRNKDLLQYADLSLADRLAQIHDTLSLNEEIALEVFVLTACGGTLQNASFIDFLRWWAAGDYNYRTLFECMASFKFKCGQSGFARRFLDEALESANLRYILESPVAEVVTTEQYTEVRTRQGQSFLAKRVICAIPLNVLNTVKFTPPLDPVKQQAVNMGHINQCVKVHAEVKDSGMYSWSGVCYPHNKLLHGFGDGITRTGKAHLVFFSAFEHHFHPEEDIEATQRAVEAFGQENVERLVFHNWSKDEFAQGAWAWYRPGMEVKYLDALRMSAGPVQFANSDWAAGAWRGFIDGALESGAEAARAVLKELRERVAVSPDY